MYRLITLLILGLILPLQAATAANKVTIYAAASMTNVLNELIELYSEKTGVRVIPVYAGSSSLARQISNGAPADIYVSANVRWVDYLKDKGVISQENIHALTSNELVLIKPADSSLVPFPLGNAELWTELLEDERLAVGQPASVPAGIYAQQALENLGVWDVVRRRIAPTNSVRVALALVERGEAELGIVYKTDALVNNKVEVLNSFPGELHDPISYPMVLINQSEPAAGFSRFLLSEEAGPVFQRYGFGDLQLSDQGLQ